MLSGITFLLEIVWIRITLLVQCFRLCPGTEGGMGSISFWRSKFPGWKEIWTRDYLAISLTFIITRHIELGNLLFLFFNILEIIRTTVLLSCLPKKHLSQWVNKISQICWVKSVWKRRGGKGLQTWLLHRRLWGIWMGHPLSCKEDEPAMGKERVINALCWLPPHLTERGGLSKALLKNHLSMWKHTLQFTFR